MQEFKFGCTSTNNQPRSRKPLDASMSEMIKNILRLETDDRKFKEGKISRIKTFQLNVYTTFCIII